MFGHRHEGKRVKGMDPIVAITPYLMPMRCDAQVFLQHDVDYETLMRYIADKSRDEGVKITFLEIIIASYVRAISQVPEVNRFIMNKQYYNRREITCSLTILMNTADGSVKENAIKLRFDPTDTIYDVSARLKQKVADNRKPENPNFAIKIASVALKIPGLATSLVALVRLLDKFGVCPSVLIDELPFHTGMFITNNASIGLHSVFHHIYNFGNTSMFFGLGTPIRGYTVNAKGETVRKCSLPIGITVDERVCGGAVFAQLFTWMKKCLSHPELLDLPPEKVFMNPGVTYRKADPYDPALVREGVPAVQTAMHA